MSRASIKSSEDGFSLVEALVALFVFALAGVALVQLQTFSLKAFARVETHALGGLVAQNRLTETVAAQATPDLGASSGEETMGGRRWLWRRVVSPTGDETIRRVDVEVRDAAAPAQRVNARGFVLVEVAPVATPPEPTFGGPPSSGPMPRTPDPPMPSGPPQPSVPFPEYPT